MDVTIQYLVGCPNWQVARDHLRAAIQQCGREDIVVHEEVVDTPEMALERRFRGSPTFLMDGVDPFAEPHAGIGLSCRLFATDDGLVGAPTVRMLLRALSSHEPA